MITSYFALKKSRHNMTSGWRSHSVPQEQTKSHPTPVACSEYSFNKPVTGANRVHRNAPNLVLRKRYQTKSDPSSDITLLGSFRSIGMKQNRNISCKTATTLLIDEHVLYFIAALEISFSWPVEIILTQPQTICWFRGLKHSQL